MKTVGQGFPTTLHHDPPSPSAREWVRLHRDSLGFTPIFIAASTVLVGNYIFIHLSPRCTGSPRTSSVFVTPGITGDSGHLINGAHLNYIALRRFESNLELIVSKRCCRGCFAGHTSSITVFHEADGLVRDSLGL